MADTPKASKKQAFISFLFWFLLFYLGLNIISGYFQDKEEKAAENPSIEVQMDKSKYVLGGLPLITISNTLGAEAVFTSPCGEGAPESLNLVQFGGSVPVTCDAGQVEGFTLAPGETKIITYPETVNEWFGKEEKFKLAYTFAVEGLDPVIAETGEFEFKKPGVFRQLFRALITKPLFNLLVFFVDIFPGHSLGLSIIALTLLVRVILFLPNQKAMASQRELQKLQPKMAEIKEKHVGNQQLIAMKTMELYKTHKINPMSSCWPILLQMPFLIGLYHIIQQGLSPHMKFFLYDFQSAIDLTEVNNFFLGLDLMLPNMLVLPILVAVAQWGAIRLSMVRQKKKTAKEGTKKPAVKKESLAGQMQQVGDMMQWVMPIMIGVFTAILPAGVGIYWITSTVFGIGQQWLVNHQLDKPKVVRKTS